MMKKIVVMMTMIIMSGTMVACGNSEPPTAVLDSEGGTENVIYENIIVEETIN